MDRLIQVLLDGDQVQAIAEVKKLRADGFEPQRITTEGIERAMEQLDAKCTVEQFNLLEIMLCGRAAMAAMKELFPLNKTPVQTKGTVVIGTLEGDIHDLGKNILKMILMTSGYRVVDCGKDCHLDKLLNSAEQEAPLVVGISGLITTVVSQVCQVRERLQARGLGQVKVLVGGGALKQASAEYLNVDYVAQNAFDGLHYLNQLTGDQP